MEGLKRVEFLNFGTSAPGIRFTLPNDEVFEQYIAGNYIYVKKDGSNYRAPLQQV